jgi:predicted phage terminase large subunit-like protein
VATIVEAPPSKVRRLRELRRLAARHRAVTWDTPGDLAAALDPRNVQTPALDLIDAALVDVAEGRCDRLIISMPPQEGKSQRVSRRFPSWLLVRDQDLRIAIASYEFGMARRWGRAIRDDLTSHSLLQVDQSSAAAHEWVIDGHDGGVYSVGIGGPLTGRPVDLLIIDDPIKDREQADSVTYRQRAWDWWTDVAVTRLAAGAPVVLILTRWHEDDLAGRLTAAEDGHLWRTINIPAQADHDPEKGQTDPLGRQPGEWLESSRGRTVEDWEAKRVAVGTRTFVSLYQGRPSPETGDVLERQWWRRYQTPLWSQQPDGSFLVEADELLQSWDMAFKDTKSSDFVVGQVWAKRGADAYLLDQVCARLSFTATIKAFERMVARWPQCTAKLVEDKANGTAVIDSLKLSVPGIVPVTPTESKYARTSAISPYVEAGNVHLPAPEIALFDVEALIEEATGFPNAVHDDQVDALSQAVSRMMLRLPQRRARMTHVSRR